MALFPAVLSALRCAGRRQLSTSTTALSALHGGGRRVRHASTFAPSETRSEVFQIERYSEVKKKLAVGEKIRWDSFLVGRKCWRVVCYPNGASDKYAGFLSVFLEYDDHPGSTAAKVRMSIVRPDAIFSETTTYSRRMGEHRFLHQGDTSGWNDFITHQELEGDPRHGEIITCSDEDSSGGGGWWTNSMAKLQDLKLPKAKHLKNDRLVFRCEVTVTDPCLTLF